MSRVRERCGVVAVVMVNKVRTERHFGEDTGQVISPSSWI